MADLITPTQVGARMRRTFTGTWLTKVEADCEDASGLIRQAADGHLDDADSTTVPAAVRRIAYEMVRRAVENPHGFLEEGTDGAVYRWKVAQGNDSIYLTDEETEIVRDVAGIGGLSGVDMTIDLPVRLYPYDHLLLESFGDL